MQRFYLSASDFSENYAVSCDREIIMQLSKVLRAKHGEKFNLFDNSGFEYLGQLVDLDKKQVKFLLIDKYPSRRELDVNIILYQSLLKSDKFDWIIQKAVELGVSKFVPVISEHCVARTMTENKIQRYKQIIKEATEQCGGAKLMELAGLMNYKQAIASAKDIKGVKIICWEQEDAVKIGPPQASAIAIFVGPEGGYSQEEINLANANGISSVSLGSRILRAETAAIVALAKVTH